MSRVIRLDFESWGDLIDRAEAPSTMADRDRSSRQQSTYRSEFTMTRDFAEALKLARDGWHEGTDRAAKRADLVCDKLGSRMMRDDFYFQTTGIMFDVDRVLQNEPECWLNYEQVNVDAPGRILRLVYNPSTSSAVSTDVLLHKGATVAALVSLLERANFRVQVDLAWCGEGDRGISFQMLCTIKRPDQDADMSRLVFAFAHPAMLRRILFSVRETLPASDRVPLRTPGRAMKPTEAPVELQGDIYIGCSNSECVAWSSERSSQRWIEAKLKEQGITLAEEDVPPPPPPEIPKPLTAEQLAQQARWAAEWEAGRAKREAEWEAGRAKREAAAALAVFEDVTEE